MTDADVPQVTKLLAKYVKQFEFRLEFNEDEEDGDVTDFISYYHLPSSVSGNPQHQMVNAAYLFYYAPKGLGDNEDRTKALVRDALIMAQQAGFDVFNCLELLSNASFLTDLKFGRGDGELHFYMYNYRCQTVDPKQMALVMI